MRDNVNLNLLLTSYGYLFDEYREAIFFLTGEGAGKALMNYNMLTGEMLYIAHDGDTLALANPKKVTNIRFGKREFIYTSKGYVEILAETNDYQTLLVHRKIKITDIKKQGAFGTTTGTVGIDNVPVMVKGKHNRSLLVNNEATFKKEITYYLQKGKSLYLGATVANFQKLFGKEQKERINNYIKEAKIDLNKEEDIIRLFNFCASGN